MDTQQSNKGCLITLTKFSDDVDAIAIPLVLATTAQAAGEEVLLWLTLDGVELARRGAASKLPPRSFPPVSDLLETFIENGGRIGICPPCGKTRNLGDEDLVANAKWMGAAALLEQSNGWRIFSF